MHDITYHNNFKHYLERIDNETNKTLLDPDLLQADIIYTEVKQAKVEVGRRYREMSGYGERLNLIGTHKLASTL